MDVEKNNLLKTGTTTVGIVCKDGIVLAADRRATAGSYIADKKAEKLHFLTENIATSIAGTVSDAQLLIRLAKSEMSLKQYRTGSAITVKEAANLMSRMVYSNIRRSYIIPGISHFVMGGKDPTGFYLYDVYADGSLTLVDEFVSSGSGSVVAYGVLESMYVKNQPVDEGVKLAVKALNAAISRDSASGDGIEVFTITKEGAKRVFLKEIKSHVEM